MGSIWRDLRDGDGILKSLGEYNMHMGVYNTTTEYRALKLDLLDLLAEHPAASLLYG
jgi:hypothetical protein